MFLEIAQLSVSYPERTRPSVDRVSLGLRAGEMGVLIGPSGCGKTTLLRAVAGLEHASAGQILLGNTVVSSSSAHVAPEARRCC
jgi:iron(III) transport system ATP-binding protein